MEKMKTEKDGLSVFPDINRYATGSLSDIPESDLFRMRWYGIFYRKKRGNFMFRIRIPSGKLTSKQANVIAHLAEYYGNGSVAITTRMGLQIREIPLQHIPIVWELLCANGLDSRQTGFDNVRNFMNCPVAGLQQDEEFDASDIITALSEKIIGNPLYSNLPRKFNISVTGCHEDCGHSKISDIGLVPHVFYEGDKRKEGFRVRFGGAIGRFYAVTAEDLGVWLPKEQAEEFVLTVLDVFRDFGDRTNRKKARLYHLKEELGLERILALINEKLSVPLQQLEDCQSHRNHLDHIGIYPQKEEGLFYIGLTVPTGKMESHQFRELARLADIYGKGELRLTAQQNAIIPHIHESRLEEFKKETLLNDFSYEPPLLLRSLIACTGKEGCDLGLVETKTPALKLVAELQERLEFSCEELRIHWSGCPNSCAIVQTADIGIHGVEAEHNGNFVDAVNIYYGGEIGTHAKIGQLIRERVPVAELTTTLIKILTDEQYFKGIYEKNT